MLANVETAIHSQRFGVVFGNAVGIEGGVPAHLPSPDFHVLNKQPFNDTLMHQQNVRVEDVDNGRVVDFSTQSMQGFVCCASPE